MNTYCDFCRALKEAMDPSTPAINNDPLAVDLGETNENKTISSSSVACTNHSLSQSEEDAVSFSASTGLRKAQFIRTLPPPPMQIRPTWGGEDTFVEVRELTGEESAMLEEIRDLTEWAEVIEPSDTFTPLTEESLQAQPIKAEDETPSSTDSSSEDVSGEEEQSSCASQADEQEEETLEPSAERVSSTDSSSEDISGEEEQSTCTSQADEQEEETLEPSAERVSSSDSSSGDVPGVKDQLFPFPQVSKKTIEDLSNYERKDLFVSLVSLGDVTGGRYSESFFDRNPVYVPEVYGTLDEEVQQPSALPSECQAAAKEFKRLTDVEDVLDMTEDVPQDRAFHTLPPRKSEISRKRRPQFALFTLSVLILIAILLGLWVLWYGPLSQRAGMDSQRLTAAVIITPLDESSIEISAGRQVTPGLLGMGGPQAKSRTMHPATVEAISYTSEKQLLIRESETESSSETKTPTSDPERAERIGTEISNRQKEIRSPQSSAHQIEGNERSEQVVEVEPEPSMESQAASAPSVEEAETTEPSPEPEPVAGNADAVGMALRTDVLEESPSRGDPSLPQTLSRAQVANGVRTILPRARNCVPQSYESVTLVFTISGSTGQIVRSSASGPLAGTVEGACVARALRRAQFPRFNDDVLTVRNFTLRIR